jgi:hypothetical protein
MPPALKAHQPTAAEVTERERQAGIAPQDEQVRRQEQNLDRTGKPLSNRAGKDTAVPHSVQPGGVVPAPSSSGTTPPSR